MERLLNFLNDQNELGMPDDVLGRLINSIISGFQPSNSGLLDDNELESIQAATGRPYRHIDATQGLNSAGEMFAATKNRNRGR